MKLEIKGSINQIKKKKTQWKSSLTEQIMLKIEYWGVEDKIKELDHMVKTNNKYTRMEDWEAHGCR